MTPHELNLHIIDYQEKRKSDNDDQITLAYLGALWQRVKKMPNFKTILNQEVKPKKQTPEAMLDEVKRLNAAMGGTIY